MMPTCPGCKIRFPLLWQIRFYWRGGHLEACRKCGLGLEGSTAHTYILGMLGSAVGAFVGIEVIRAAGLLPAIVFCMLLGLTIGILDRWFLVPLKIPESAIQSGRVLT